LAQVAIHEAMEQQTISLAKAGMKATLNARTSILAAANPAGGRYDRSKPLKYNVALPPAILSRFDLVHVMVDEIDEHVDYSIARHIVGVHQRQVEGMEEEERAPYTKIAMQRYIRYARSIKPVLSTAARKAIVSAYIKLRQGDAAPGSGTAYKITVRQLEAMVRLSEAMARLHHKKEISPNHVVEARRLLSNSIIHVAPTEVQMEPDYNDTPQNGDEFAQELAEVGGGAFSRVPTDEEMAAEASAAVDEAAEAAGVATETEEVDAEVAAAAAAAAAPKEELKVSSEKYHKVTEMLVKRLREAEDAGAAGLKQFELVSWYMDVHVQAQAFDSYESMSKEFKLVKAVINNLVKRDGTLIIIEEAESGAQRERVLAVNPNVVAAGDQ
jgi:DNA replication licensing factor MCM6